MLICGLPAPSQQQPPISSSSQPGGLQQLIEELTKEVRSLRLSLEQWHKEDGGRLVVLERYRVQHEIAAAASDRLDAVRSELSEFQIEVAKSQEHLQEVEQKLQSNTDSQQQQSIETAARDAREALGQLRARELRLTDRERQLAVDSDEQNRKLQSLEQSLDAIAKPSVQ